MTYSGCPQYTPVRTVSKHCWFLFVCVLLLLLSCSLVGGGDPSETGARTHCPCQSTFTAHLLAPGATAWPCIGFPRAALACNLCLVSLLSGHCGHSEHLVFLLGGYFISLCNPHRRKPVTHFQPDTSMETGSKQRWGTKQSHCSLSRESWAGI